MDLLISTCTFWTFSEEYTWIHSNLLHIAGSIVNLFSIWVYSNLLHLVGSIWIYYIWVYLDLLFLVGSNWIYSVSFSFPFAFPGTSLGFSQDGCHVHWNARIFYIFLWSFHNLQFSKLKAFLRTDAWHPLLNLNGCPGTRDTRSNEGTAK